MKLGSAEIRTLASMAAWLLSACGQLLSVPISIDSVPVGLLTLPSDPSPNRARAKARLELAQAYFEQGQMQIAMQEVALAQTADPQWIAVHNLKGLVLERMGQSELARISFEEGLRWALRNPSLGSELADLQHNWGLWLCTHGSTDKGIAQLNRASSQPGYAWREKTQLAISRCPQMARG
jgi:type IV pilus assembly protein PilF